MPIYDYRCVACSHRFEVIHGVHGEGPAACPACGAGPMVKAVTAPAVHFKGSGWAKMERRSTAGSSSSSVDRSTSGSSDDGIAGPSKAGDGDSGSLSTKDTSDGAKRESSKPKVETASKGDDGPRSGQVKPSPTGSSGGD